MGLISVSRTIPAMQSRRAVSAINWKLCHREVRVETAVHAKRAISECWSITENENTGSPFILVPCSDPLVLTLHEFKSLTANKPQSSNALWKCRAVLLNSFQFSILQLFSLPLYSMNETNKNVVLLLVSSVIVEGSDGWDLHTVLVLPASQGFHPQFLCRNLFFSWRR